MTLVSPLLWPLPSSPSRWRATARISPIASRRRLCVSSSATDSNDPVSKLLRENPSRVERKVLVGDKLYTVKQLMLERTPAWKKLASEVQSLAAAEESRKPEAAEAGAEVTSEAEKPPKPVYLRQLLREYKGDLYVPEEVFMGQVSEIDEFNKEFRELPVMLLQDFLRLAEADQISSLKSKGTSFIVNLKSYPGEVKCDRWAMQLTEAEARYALSQFRGYHREILPRFAPMVVQPPPTPNPVAAAISGRLMLEFTTVISLISSAAFATSRVASTIVTSFVSALVFFIFRVIVPVLSPIIRPLVLLVSGLVRGVLGTVIGKTELGSRKGIVGLLSGAVDLVTSGDILGSLRSLAIIFSVLVVMAGFSKFTLTRRSRDHQKWDIWQAINFGQSKPEARVKGSTGVTFADVAGINPIVNELQELVKYLKKSDEFSQMGTKPPHGVLLEGPPGCGKTLLAKAVAGEAGVPFYQMAGSEFVEVLVGVGAARMRDLFLRAQVNRPAVVFIDEIDALGGARSRSSMGTPTENLLDSKFNSGLQERETTLNQLLIELDGFDTGKGVIFMGATNRADMLDPALLRPGRFDRRILIPLPKAKARNEILQVHAKKVKLDPSVDLWIYAKNLKGWNGAQLAQLMQESALVARRRGRKAIMSHDVDTAVDLLTVGPEVTGVGRRQSIHRRMATIEIGMAMVAHLLRAAEDAFIESCDRISILPRGMTYSRTIYQKLNDEDYFFSTRDTLIHRLKVFLGARLAEEIVYGRETSTLSAPYLADANWLARKMYTIWNIDGPISMHGELPPWRRYAAFGPPLTFEGGLYEDYGMVDRSLNPEIDKEATTRATELVERAYRETSLLLRQYKAALIKALHVIMDKEEIYGEELNAILDHYKAGYPVELVEAEDEPASLAFLSNKTEVSALPA